MAEAAPQPAWQTRPTLYLELLLADGRTFRVEADGLDAFRVLLRDAVQEV